MIEDKLAQVLAGYRTRRDGYLSTSKSYTSKCHVMKRLELEKLAKVCDMHINELQRAIEGFSSVQVDQAATPRRRARNTAQTVAEVRSDAGSNLRSNTAEQEPSHQGSGQVDVSEVRHDYDGT